MKATCDLCKKAEPRSTESLLCQDCADAIGRVMSCDLYEANYSKDLEAQLAQVRLLMDAARISSDAAAVKPEGQRGIWF